MAEQWGAPLTGAQMKLLRLNEGDRYQFFGPFTHTWGEYERGIDDGWDVFEDSDYRLPADHTAYTLLEAGWLDGRNVRLWFGGDRAPDDWDGGRVLLGCGVDVPCPLNWRHNVPDDCIIAYIAKDEVMESDEPDTVTIAKMTESEAREWVRTNTFGLSYSDAVNCLSRLGLIKETTREERFWEGIGYRKSAFGDEIVDIVKKALEFER